MVYKPAVCATQCTVDSWLLLLWRLAAAMLARETKTTTDMLAQAHAVMNLTEQKGGTMLWKQAAGS